MTYDRVRDRFEGRGCVGVVEGGGRPGMSVELRATADIAVPIERAWAVWIDAARYPQWQGGLLAVTDVDGPLDVVGTTFVLDHGPKLKRTARVVAVERPVRHVIEQTGAVRQRELEVLTGQRRRLTDGLLFSPLALGQEDAATIDVGYPLVLLGERIFDGPSDHVTMANVDAARAATDYLLRAGRRQIALVGAHPGETVGSAGLRERGYRQAIEAAGLAVNPALIAEAGLWHRSTGADAMRQLLDSGTPVDAVFALNDAMALGVLHVLHDRRISVPDEVAVVGFDDIDEAKYSSPTLTTVSPGREQIARTAVDLLRERIVDGAAAGPYRQVVADFSIVVRESTGFPL